MFSLAPESPQKAHWQFWGIDAQAAL